MYGRGGLTHGLATGGGDNNNNNDNAGSDKGSGGGSDGDDGNDSEQEECICRSYCSRTYACTPHRKRMAVIVKWESTTSLRKSPFRSERALRQLPAIPPTPQPNTIATKSCYGGRRWHWNRERRNGECKQSVCLTSRAPRQ